MTTRQPTLRIHTSELVVDLFAGGGGASEGIRLALGRDPDIAINHDPEAIAMHKANHPGARHYISDVWEVDPVEACGGRPVGFAWFSPDCTHHSKAKGGKPKNSKRRALAWAVVRWARAVRPRVIMLENVEEFEDWGPLDNEGQPIEAKRGLTFRMWLGKLRALGYAIEMRQLRACDYGAPTSRKRLFIIARCDGEAITWPAATHDPSAWRTAAECINWSLPVPSIFAPGRDLCANTLRRIAHGVVRHVIEAPNPYIVGDAGHTLIQTGQGERRGQAPRVPGLRKPLGTVVANRSGHALVSAFLAKHYGGHEGPGIPLTSPFSTITTQDHHALVAAFLVKYYGSATDGQSLRLPLGTLTTRDRFGLVTVAGERYRIDDVGMRFIVPREQFRAQGFRDDYEIAPVVGRKPIGTKAQTRMCGNSVSPPVARELVAANMGTEQRVAA